MSHVDEGALHAYLDGALDEYPAAEARRVREHVETCAVCAERLAEERRVRDDARAVLALAAPQVEVPSFEELRAYVRAHRSPRAASGRLYKMGWAASVVLALGTGWFLRGGQIDPTTGAFRAEGGSPAPARSADETAAAATESAREEADRDVAAETPVVVPAPAEPAPAATFERTLSEPAAVASTARTDVVQQTPAGQPAAPTSAPYAQVGQLAAGARASDDAPASASASGGAGFGGVVASLDSPPRLSDARIQERIDSAARVAESRRRMAASDQVVTSAVDAAAPAAPALQRARANEVERQEAEESGSLVVPGLEVLDVLPVSEGTAFAGVRNLQRLENGDTLEVIHLPEGVDPSLLPPLPPDESELVRPTPEGWLVMRARVPQAYLQQLLERLQAVR